MVPVPDRPIFIGVAKVGLVLGGGGITGAAYQLAGLMALELATGWDPGDAEVVVGTSAGATVAAVVRAGRITLDALVQTHEGRAEVAERIRTTIYRRGGSRQLSRWLRHGIAASLRSPGLTFALGSPALFDPAGIADWVRHQAGPIADSWPQAPTAIVAIDIATKQRTVFGTEDAPATTLADAAAASSAIPMMFNPHIIAGRAFVDGGIASGTHADLVLAHPEPLDLVIVLPALAEEERRVGGRIYEPLFDRVGWRALEDEIALITDSWPVTDVIVIRPPSGALAAMRPNPLDPEAAVPSFIRTLSGLRTTLAEPATWNILERHLGHHHHTV